MPVITGTGSTVATSALSRSHVLTMIRRYRYAATTADTMAMIAIA